VINGVLNLNRDERDWVLWETTEILHVALWETDSERIVMTPVSKHREKYHGLHKMPMSYTGL
jgi:hypothetical protein